MKENKPLVIYHKYCLDGFGAAFAAWKKFGDTVEYLPLAYPEREDFILSGEAAGRDLYINGEVSTIASGGADGDADGDFDGDIDGDTDSDGEILGLAEWPSKFQ